jgi:hypothetical protein
MKNASRTPRKPGRPEVPVHDSHNLKCQSVRLSLTEIDEVDAALKRHNRITSRATKRSQFIREIVLAHVRHKPLPAVREAS